jgi:Transcriptional regulator, AbiEi antitoxin
VAARQHGILPLSQLIAHGLTAAAVRYRAAMGRLHRIHHGVYALVPPPLLTIRGCYLAAVFACGPEAALSHRSAAGLHGLRRNASGRVEVIVPGRSTRCHDPVEVHRSIRFDRALDVTVVDAIPLTTVARTLLDLAAVVPRRALERALDQAEILRVFDLNALRDQIARNPGHPGAGKLRFTLDRHTAGDAVTESEFEERFYAVLDAAGLPRPEVNAYVNPGDGERMIRPDYVWRAAKVAVETDGAKFHLTRTAFETDRHRDQRLHHARWRPIRITWRQLRDDPAWVVALLKDLLEAA